MSIFEDMANAVIKCDVGACVEKQRFIDQIQHSNEGENCWYIELLFS